jgi:hypothetical protein
VTEQEQPGYDPRLEWAADGTALLARACPVLVVVDVLRFTTAVEVAVARGARVAPHRWRGGEAGGSGGGAAGSGAGVGALPGLGAGGGPGPYSLSLRSRCWRSRQGPAWSWRRRTGRR